MKADEASRTAESSAALRAIHLIRHGEPKIFEDAYAMRLTSRRWQRIIGSRFLYWLVSTLRLGPPRNWRFGGEGSLCGGAA